jgi:hypothetical protein
MRNFRHEAGSRLLKPWLPRVVGETRGTHSAKSQDQPARLFCEEPILAPGSERDASRCRSWFTAAQRRCLARFANYARHTHIARHVRARDPKQRTYQIGNRGRNERARQPTDQSSTPIQCCTEPRPARHSPQPQNWRSLPRSIALGFDPVLVPRPEGRPQTNQLEIGDSREPTDVPRSLRASPTSPRTWARSRSGRRLCDTSFARRATFWRTAASTSKIG